MNLSKQAARPTAFAQSLFLPLEAPRDAWPMLIERAADALASETLAFELRAIADALRADRLTRAARALAADAGLQDIDRDDPRLLSLATLVRGGAA